MRHSLETHTRISEQGLPTHTQTLEPLYSNTIQTASAVSVRASLAGISGGVAGINKKFVGSGLQAAVKTAPIVQTGPHGPQGHRVTGWNRGIVLPPDCRISDWSCHATEYCGAIEPADLGRA